MPRPGASRSTAWAPGGLDLGGEYVLRQISQYTYGTYIFLTYGERGESEGGVAGSVSHHTGANYQTDRLEAIIIRLARQGWHISRTRRSRSTSKRSG